MDFTRKTVRMTTVRVILYCFVLVGLFAGFALQGEGLYVNELKNIQYSAKVTGVLG